MFSSPRMVSLRVPDIGEARRWYRDVLGQEPNLDAPFAVVFTIGDCALILLPQDNGDHPEERCVAFFGVDDIEAAFKRLIGAGATARSEITLTMLKSRVATVVDPFGNVLGVTSTAEEAKAVDSRPSESAMTVAFSRALAAHDDREGLHGPDHLAEVFLNEDSKKTLDDRATREWILGKMAGAHQYFLARTLYLDGIVERSLRAGVPQVVFLGAGYDTRPYRFKDLLVRTRIFELDVAPTQQRKREMLEAAGVDIPAEVTYATLDFEKKAIGDVLLEAGFDPSQKTLFIWEGVTYYLTARAVDHTLDAVRRQAPQGSALCFDYMIEAPDMSSRYRVKEVLEAWRAAYSGERVQFGIKEGTIRTFLSKRGYDLVEHLGPIDLEQRFLSKFGGGLAGRVVALFGVVHATVSEPVS